MATRPRPNQNRPYNGAGRSVLLVRAVNAPHPVPLLRTAPPSSTASLLNDPTTKISREVGDLFRERVSDVSVLLDALRRIAEGRSETSGGGADEIASAGIDGRRLGLDAASDETGPGAPPNRGGISYKE